MTAEQYQQMIKLQNQLAIDADSLLQQYRKLRFSIFGAGGDFHRDMAFDEVDTNNEDPGWNPPEEDEDENGNWVFNPDRNNPKYNQAKWDHKMKYGVLKYKAHLGYEYAHDYYELPFAWLFDDRWPEKAIAALEREKQKLEQSLLDLARKHEAEDLETLQRLVMKYAPAMMGKT